MPGPDVQVFCVPHAGGTASAFRRWNTQIGEGLCVVPLELAGRGLRNSESFSPTVHAAAADLIKQMTVKRNGIPFVLLGHCMGAVIAFEMARQLKSGGYEEPMLLVVSGRNPPYLANEWSRKVAPLQDDDLFTELQAVGGVPSRLSRAMANTFLPVFRADQAMVRNYNANGRGPRVSPPILILSGDTDFMTSGDLLPDWNVYTEATCAVRELPGNHYFVYSHVAEVGELIREQLRPLLDMETSR